MPNTSSAAGMTPREVGRLLRMSPDRVRAMIERGELQALNLAATKSAKPRYVVLSHHLADFEAGHAAARPKTPPHRRRPKAPAGQRDYFPD